MENSYIFIARLKQSKDIRQITVKTKTLHMETPEIKKKNKTDTLLEEIDTGRIFQTNENCKRLRRAVTQSRIKKGNQS